MPNSDPIKNATGLAGVINGFLFAAVNNEVTRTPIDPVTDDFTFISGGVTKFIIRMVWSDVAKSDFDSAKRTT